MVSAAAPGVIHPTGMPATVVPGAMRIMEAAPPPIAMTPRPRPIQRPRRRFLGDGSMGAQARGCSPGGRRDGLRGSSRRCEYCGGRGVISLRLGCARRRNQIGHELHPPALKRVLTFNGTGWEVTGRQRSVITCLPASGPSVDDGDAVDLDQHLLARQTGEDGGARGQDAIRGSWCARSRRRRRHRS